MSISRKLTWDKIMDTINHMKKKVTVYEFFTDHLSLLLAEYLVRDWSDDRRGKFVQEFKARVIDMPWKISSSAQDHNLGIYVMRHMEEYKGVPTRWDVGLKKMRLLEFTN